MIKQHTNRFLIILSGILSLTLAPACADLEPEATGNKMGHGEPAVVVATINETAEVNTRAIHNAYDNWSVAKFTLDDNVGLFAIKGLQDEENPDSYDVEIKNGKMYFESASGSYYRFSNSELILNPQIVHDNYSIMYYPYYEGMPDPRESSTQVAGLPLRLTDDNDQGKEKCVDFMQTSMYSYTSYGSYYSSTVHKLPISSGILQPSFYHYMSEIVVQRGDGFTNATDKRVWVVMKDSYTDIRVRLTSSTTNYTYQLQNALDTGEKIGLPTPSSDPSQPVPPVKVTVNKNRAWEAWKGEDYNSIESYYVIIPPAEVSYILMQDDNQNWRAVTDFFLDFPTNTTSKTGKNNCRYIVTAQMQGIDPIIRPVTVENWTDGGALTDQYEAGINTLPEYSAWVALYNAYNLNRYNNDRGEEWETWREALKKYGDVVKNTETGEAKWTFYINANLKLPDDFTDVVITFDDKLMGASVYTNYRISNIKGTLFDEMGENGAIEAIDFHDIYIIDTKDNGHSSTGGIVREINGGFFENCRIVNGIIVSNKPAGMLGGKVSSVTLKNCYISGQVIGSESAQAPYTGLFGTDPDDVSIINSNYKELYFETFN